MAKLRCFRIGRLTIYPGKIHRGSNGSDPPWRGYCWGSDWPKARLQKSSWCYCLDISWLMYFVSVYWARKEQTNG